MPVGVGNGVIGGFVGDNVGRRTISVGDSVLLVPASTMATLVATRRAIDDKMEDFIFVFFLYMLLESLGLRRVWEMWLLRVAKEDDVGNECFLIIVRYTTKNEPHAMYNVWICDEVGGQKYGAAICEGQDLKPTNLFLPET